MKINTPKTIFFNKILLDEWIQLKMKQTVPAIVDNFQ